LPGLHAYRRPYAFRSGVAATGMLRWFLKKFVMDGETSSIPLVSPRQAFEGMQNGELTLVDVRQPEEWAFDGSPEGANQVALQRKDFVDQVTDLVTNKKETPIAVCCRSGLRGEKAGKLLQASGFANVVNVEGGMMRWLAEKLPVA